MNSITGERNTNNFYYKYANTINTASRWLNNFGVIFLIIMMFATVVDVTLRLFNVGVLGAYEVVEFTMVITVFFCIAFAQADKQNVAVEILYNKLGRKAQVVLELFNYAICFILMCIVVYASIMGTIDIYNFHAVSAVLLIPMYPFYIVQVIGYVMLALVLLGDFLIQVARLVYKDY